MYIYSTHLFDETIIAAASLYRELEQGIFVLDKLLLADGSTITEQSQILQETVQFDKDLYSEEPTDGSAQQILFKNIKVTLSTEETSLCEGNISLKEATEAIKSFSNNKSLGTDGLTREFYIKFRSMLGRDRVNVLNFALQNGLLSHSQHTGVIILLYKKAEKEFLKNWRPITQFNIDYKVLTKCLAQRLRKVLPLIISSDQTCSVKGRFIFETISLIRDTIEYVNEFNEPGAILCLDQMKAFDRLS